MTSVYHWINSQLRILQDYKGHTKSELEKKYIQERLNSMLDTYIKTLNWKVDSVRIKEYLEKEDKISKER